MTMPNYGKRQDGTDKGSGFFGELPRPDGNISTELSIGVDFGKGETEIPLLVPTLSRPEIDYLLSGGKPTQAIVDKASANAVDRMANGASPFAQEGEQGPLPADQNAEQQQGFDAQFAPAGDSTQ